ncbi:hypothetical protein KOW79_022674 [Hemibagrus wyckioides]|uniref:Ligand-dependent nuclear receptor corepressor-like protein n=1 Tax=Hemibagrus wyckioides TaxID=337641 RepID=A0A9D3SBR8_9TELE|nr:protein piccolo isoform X2 [Hemibagrus wyckioides]KAG7314178.1 hypothetical protein KOW79_022674 [Hemibagrus wyckioides]
MATRCCSARCSAERKGFRRELDSWRHKLIHCVGFESILEGIYGPRLLQDLSIFINCEPEATADWSTDARCSFCNLQLEKISDRLPDSPPHAETPPQGINTSDTLQCQADQFLHAVLHKKEFPESCDPIIPLAAQELMRKMIRQFAVEYAHKIQTTESQNAITQTEPDGPLDLTLSRNTQCAQQDGVLDLSKKNTPSLNTLVQQRLSGCLETKEEESKTKEIEERQQRRGTVLEEVMTSLCSHHKVLLLHILQEMTSFLPKDECGPAVMQRDVRGTVGALRSKYGGHCCHADESLCVLSSRVSSGCVCSCRLGVCAMHSVCLCMKSCSGFSCRSVMLGCAGCCARSRTLVCQHTHCSDITHVARTGSDTHSCCHSPSPPPLSPPPLSPKPQDTESACDPDMPTLNTHTLNTQPPPLLPHNAHTDQMLMPETHGKPEHFIDLMDKFTDTLMEASEREWSVHTHTGDSVKSCDDTHLTEIITTVLHSSSEKDYNLKELFEQHLASEKRSPQTRSQRRQEVMQAISRSQDQAATRRQSLQIKRDLARLEPDVSRKKKRKTHLITHGTHNQIPVTPISHTQNPDTPISHDLSPDTPISHAPSPDTPTSNIQSLDTPISHAQSPDMPTSHTQSPDTPILNSKSPDMRISPAQSPNMPISNSQSINISTLHRQSPGTPISHAQSSDTPISHAQSLDTPMSNSQISDTPISNFQCPNIPISHTQNPKMPISKIQSPAVSYGQNPNTPISCSQSPDTPISQDQSPGTPISHAQISDTSILHTQSPDMATLHDQDPETPISHTQSPDMAISHDQDPEMPISHSQSPDTATSHDQNPEKPISHTQSPDTAVSHDRDTETLCSHTQSPDTPNLHTQNSDKSSSHARNSDTPSSHTQSPDTPSSHARNSETPISHTQSPDTASSHTQSPETASSHTQSQDTASSHTQSPDTASSHIQSPDMTSSHTQSPDTASSHIQSPDMTSSHTQSPDTPSSHTQSPDMASSHIQSPDTASSHSQSPDMASSHTQSPDMASSHTQSPDMASSHIQSPDTASSHTQSPDTASSHTQSPDMPNSHTENTDTVSFHIKNPDTVSLHNQRPDMPSSHNQSPETPSSHNQSLEAPSSHNQSPEMPSSHNQSPETPSSHNQSPETLSLHNQSPEKAEACGNVRSRRNIVRPQRLSSYVTEPRKMFYAACRSAKNNSTLMHGTDTPESPPSAVPGQIKTPPVSPNRIKVCKDENSPQPHAERQLRVKTRRSKEVTRSPSPVVTDLTDVDDVKYASPIKLMLVSTIKDEDGVKYKLRAAQTHSDEESFDPCVEASWAPNTLREQAKDKTVQKMSNECTEKLSAEEFSNTEALRECNNSVNEAETSIKRRPGRPKKLKAPTEKAVKRPIGRPRKCKPVNTNTVPTEDTEKQGVEDAPSGEDGNKNLKITITYGRRKARRMVSEGQVPAEQSKGRTQSSNAEKPTQFTQVQGSMNKDQFSLVMPVEDRKSLTHSIMCPKQSDGIGSRRPGRPAKVKISGISVTVTTVSPQQRKIHMKRDIRGPAIQRRALFTELEPNKEQETITEDGQASVRHSVRERRPSIHLLQCVAMSRSNIPTPRSRKLPMHKSDETQQETQQHEPNDANDTTTRPNTSPQDAVSFSAASVESLFDANLQWWPTSASPETLKDEMNKRLKVMKETWVSDTSDVATSDEDKSSAPSSSAVRMLFERDCSMETLCSWFMQTTETQSLAIVKKANNRNPCEVFQYSSAQASDRPNVCSSPQAERLKKCIKKFATIVPKSPMKLRRAQAKVPGTQKCLIEQHVLNTTANNSEKSQQCGAWHLYRTTLDRARSRFKYRTKNTDVDYKSLNEQEESGIQPRSVSENGLLNTLQSESRRTSAQQKQITANAWSPHTLRECKVFLRKLNSANTRSMSEESNDCSVRFSVSPAGGVSVQHREQGVRKSIKPEKTSNSGTSTRQQSKVNRKRRHSCTNLSPPSPKRQRSSRGVMAAKWSDFILGPAR